MIYWKKDGWEMRHTQINIIILTEHFSLHIPRMDKTNLENGATSTSFYCIPVYKKQQIPSLHGVTAKPFQWPGLAVWMNQGICYRKLRVLVFLFVSSNKFLVYTTSTMFIVISLHAWPWVEKTTKNSLALVFVFQSFVINVY